MDMMTELSDEQKENVMKYYFTGQSVSLSTFYINPHSQVHSTNYPEYVRKSVNFMQLHLLR